MTIRSVRPVATPARITSTLGLPPAVLLLMGRTLWLTRSQGHRPKGRFGGSSGDGNGSNIGRVARHWSPGGGSIAPDPEQERRDPPRRCETHDVVPELQSTATWRVFGCVFDETSENPVHAKFGECSEDGSFRGWMCSRRRLRWAPRVLEEGSAVATRKRRSADAGRCAHASPVVVEPAVSGRRARCLVLRAGGAGAADLRGGAWGATRRGALVIAGGGLGAWGTADR